MDPQSAVQAKSDRLTAFVESSLEEGEVVVAVLALGTGPLSPLTPLIPGLGLILMMTRWLRNHGIVVTDRRLLLVRKTRRAGIPKRLDLAVPLSEVRVTEWRATRSSGLLQLDAAGRRIRLHVVGQYHLQMPALLEALHYGD